ncbi:hypothetical protein G7061_04410 [Erysipelothrix sp. HDW6B]|uniref:hypothetical protein n=1 Tax=Erysipelothrix TaxID=1647 RepID=UPI001359B166|nr:MULTISPECIES: hypothetical protein [Erysipelothrix]QIK85894.1 hypothetical protein G7061_04410 [Erysipelothrix sp. HDW6B]
MEAIINTLVKGISTMFRFDIEKDPRGARKKSLIIILIFIILLYVGVIGSLIN